MENKTMKAAQFKELGGPLVLVDLPIPKPAQGQVRVKVMACGVCHSDVIAKYGAMGKYFPRTPGHEVVGTVDELGDGVKGLKKGDKVGVGWFGGNCGECINCKKDVLVCCKKGQVCGVTMDGGYAQYMVCPANACAMVPENIKPEEAAPLMCAGITTYNALKNSDAKPGDLVVVSGVGGLGHLGIQFANKMGFQVVAVSNGTGKEELAKKLGAHHYLDGTKTKETVEFINNLGGAQVVLATAPSAQAIEDLIPALGVNGQIIVVGVADRPLSVNSLALLSGRQSIKGWASGDARDSESCMNFASISGVRPMIECFPLEKAEEAVTYMLANKAKFRCVITVPQ